MASAASTCRVGLGVGLALCVNACVSGHYPEVENEHRQRINQIWLWTVERMVNPVCDGRDSEHMGTLVHVVYIHGRIVMQGCGWVAVDVTDREFLDKFVSEVCGGKDGEECSRAHTEMYIARLADRYPFADWSTVANKCKAFPIDCKRYMWIERWVTHTHNEALKKWSETAYAQERARYKVDYEHAYNAEVERRNRVLRGVSAFLEGANSVHAKVRCTSQTTGSTTRTTCY